MALSAAPQLLDRLRALAEAEGTVSSLLFVPFNSFFTAATAATSPFWAPSASPPLTPPAVDSLSSSPPPPPPLDDPPPNVFLAFHRSRIVDFCNQ